MTDYPSLKDYFNEFCSTTGVRGFSFIKSSRYLPERFIWTCLIICGTILTIWDCSVTTSRYMSKPTTVRTTVILNRTMDLGKATLCIEINVGEMRFGSIDLNNHQSVSQFLEDLPVDFDLVKYLKSYVYNESIESPLSGTMFRSLLSLSTAVLGAIVRYESLSGKQVGNFTWSPPTVLADEVVFEDRNNSYSIYLFYEYLMLSEVNITEIVPLVSVLLCRVMEVQGSIARHYSSLGKTATTTKPLCSLEAMTWLGYPPMSDPISEMVCLKAHRVLPMFFEFQSTAEYSVVSIHSANLYRKKYANILSAYIDFSGSIAKTHMSQNVVDFPLNKRSSIVATVQMIGHFRQMSTARFSCSPTGLFSMCQVSCRIEFIKTTCNCTPVSAALFRETNDKSACSNLDYSTLVSIVKKNGHNFLPYANFKLPNCDKFTKTENPGTTCAKSCLRDCETRLLSLYALPKEVDNNNATQLTVSVDPFLYPFVEEFELIDFRQFLGSLGGNLSLWLGASFIVLVHLVVFMLKILIQQSVIAVKRRSNSIAAGSNSHANSALMTAL